MVLAPHRACCVLSLVRLNPGDVGGDWAAQVQARRSAANIYTCVVSDFARCRAELSSSGGRGSAVITFGGTAAARGAAATTSRRPQLQPIK
jgi:hypothetical protein